MLDKLVKYHARIKGKTTPHSARRLFATRMNKHFQKHSAGRPQALAAHRQTLESYVCNRLLLPLGA
jgi:hypothetical protein